MRFILYAVYYFDKIFSIEIDTITNIAIAVAVTAVAAFLLCTCFFLFPVAMLGIQFKRIVYSCFHLFFKV